MSSYGTVAGKFRRRLGYVVPFHCTQGGYFVWCPVLMERKSPWPVLAGTPAKVTAQA